MGTSGSFSFEYFEAIRVYVLLFWLLSSHLQKKENKPAHAHQKIINKKEGNGERKGGKVKN